MYNEYTEDELIEVYLTMIDYSGKADPEVLKEIEKRGGMPEFLEKIRQKEVHKAECIRVLNALIQFDRDGIGLNEIKKNISSDIWTKEQLNVFIDSRYTQHQLIVHDKKIDSAVVLRSTVGTLIASIFGSLIWGYSMVFFEAMVFPILIAVYFISYFILRMIVGKSQRNAMVLFAGVLATILSFIVGCYLFGEMQTN